MNDTQGQGAAPSGAPAATSSQTAQAQGAPSTESLLYGEGAQRPSLGQPNQNQTPAEPSAGEMQTPNASGEPKDPASGEKLDLKLPENSLLAPQVIDEIQALAKEHGLNQRQAELMLQRESDRLKEYSKAQQDQFSEMADKWVEDVRADKEIGGANFNENVSMAARVIQKFGTDELRKALNDSKYGNFPELVRIFARIGKVIGEDQLVKSGPGGPRTKSIEEIFYGSSNP